jgi:hypothetical protein
MAVKDHQQPVASVIIKVVNLPGAIDDRKVECSLACQ